jgi:hypothetical protein
MINRSWFSPILHPTLTEYYRTPVFVKRQPDDIEYEVSVYESVCRYYNEKTVPKEIKALVAMVDAFPYLQNNTPHSLLTTTAYHCPDPRQIEIGWRVTDDLYVLILHHQYLASIALGSDDG